MWAAKCVLVCVYCLLCCSEVLWFETRAQTHNTLTNNTPRTVMSTMGNGVMQGASFVGRETMQGGSYVAHNAMPGVLCCAVLFDCVCSLCFAVLREGAHGIGEGASYVAHHIPGRAIEHGLFSVVLFCLFCLSLCCVCSLLSCRFGLWSQRSRQVVPLVECCVTHRITHSLKIPFFELTDHTHHPHSSLTN